MAKYYFTYGTDGQPFRGGWTEVEAKSEAEAIAAFRSKHPDRIDGLVNCAGIYTARAFRVTQMYGFGNFGKFCQEKISAGSAEKTKEDTDDGTGI